MRIKMFNLKDFLQKRIALSTEAFQRARARKSQTLTSAAEIVDIPKVVGWLYPSSGSDPKAFALVPGTQYLTVGKCAAICANPDVAASSAVRIEVFPDRVEVDARTVYLGEKVTLGAQTYRLAMLPARALTLILKGFATLTLALMLCHISSAPALAQGNEMHAAFREVFTAHVILPGLNRIGKIEARVNAGNDSYPLRVIATHQTNTHYLILYDGSALCTLRKMEGLLTQEISELLQNFDPNSRFTLVRYDQNQGAVNDNHINYERVFPAAIRVGSVQFHSGLVSCNAQTLSVNGLVALSEMSQQIFKDEKERKVVILFSPGHLTALPKENMEALKKLNISYIHTVVFSPVESETVQTALTSLEDISTVTSWAKPEPLHLAKLLKYAWDFDLRATLPTSLAEGRYQLAISIDDGAKGVNFPLIYSLNSYNLLLYHFWIVLGIVVSLLLLGFIIYRLVDYYRIHRCPVDGMILSRDWNQCLFCAQDKHPVLLVGSEERRVEKAFVLDGQVTRIGGRFADKLRLRRARHLRSLRLTRVLPETFELTPEKGQIFVLNGQARDDSVYLKHGDNIQLGPYHILFLRSHAMEANA